MSKSVLLIIAVFAALPHDANGKAPTSKPSQPTAQETAPPTVTISELVVQLPPKDEKPKGYWERVGEPENLPNILLVVVGLFGIPIALVTLIAIWQQTKAMQETLDISKKTLLLQFRPILTVRGLRAQGFLQNPKYPEEKVVFLAIENTGGSDARIISSEIAVKIVDYATAMFSLMEGASSLEKKTLKPGEGLVNDILIGDDLANAMIAETAHPDDPNWDGHKLIMCVGNIKYQDDLNITRTLGLYRRFNPVTFEFTPMNATDSEYKSG
jgi:hypothetical protein